MEEFFARAENIDLEVVEKVSQMNYPKNLIIEAVKCGPDLLSEWNHPRRDELRPIAVAYNLLLDDKRKLEYRKSLFFSVGYFRFIQTTYYFFGVIAMEILAEGLEAKREELMLRQISNSLAKLRLGDGIVLPVPEQRYWHCGFVSCLSPGAIMARIYKALGQLQIVFFLFCLT